MSLSIHMEDLPDGFENLDPLDFYQSSLIFPHDKELADLMDVLLIDNKHTNRISQKHNKWNFFKSINTSTEIHWSQIESQCSLTDFATKTEHIPSPLPFQHATATLIVSPHINDEINDLYLILNGGYMDTKSFQQKRNGVQNTIIQQIKDTHLFLYHLNSFKWYALDTKATTPEIKNNTPFKRYGHCSVLFGKHNSYLWTFGGRKMDPTQTPIHTTSPDEPITQLCTNTIFVLSLQDFTWKSIKSNHTNYHIPCPEARYDASAILVQSHGTQGTILLYGGRNSSNQIMNDLWLWDISTKMWNRPILLGDPPVLKTSNICMVETSQTKIIFWEEYDSETSFLSDSYSDGIYISSSSYNNDYDSNSVAIFDLKNNEWMRPSSLLSKSIKADPIRSFFIGRRRYTFFVTLTLDASLHTFYVGRWRWNLSGLIRDATQLKQIVKERKNEINAAIKTLEKQKSKISCVELKHTYHVCQFNLKRLLDDTCEYTTSRSCHLIFRVGSKLYTTSQQLRNKDEYIDTVFVTSLSNAQEMERRHQIKSCSEHEQNCLKIHRDLVNHRNKMILDEKIQKEKDMTNEGIERRYMKFEDELSHLPPLSVAPTVQLGLATRGMICVKWPKVTINSRGLPVNTDKVEYTLKVRGGYFRFQKKAKVIVKQNDVNETLLRAIIVKNQQNVLFDVQYDDGIAESNITRKRISPEQSQWEVVFSGKNQFQYGYQAIPCHVLEREKIRVSCEFLLQTRGTELPLDTYSQPSKITRYYTSCG